MSNMRAATFDTGILAPGETVLDGEYEVAERLGGGNSGEVYRLSHPKHGENRVVKLFIPFYELRQAQLGQDEHGELTNRIIENAKNQPYQQREYTFLSSLDHPFIVKVHDFGLESLTSVQAERLRRTTGGAGSGQIRLPYIVAAFVDGQSFDKGLSRLDRDGVFRVLHSIAEALDYLHVEHAYLHLDIKSANVRVRPDGYPILLDFALSQDLSEPALLSKDLVKGGIDWDLTPFRLGLMLRASAATIAAVLTPAEQKYFELLVADLVVWSEVRKAPAGELAKLVHRIDATRFFLAIRPGSMSGGREMPLSNGRVVFVPPKLVPIVNHPELTRLNRLNQLSLLPARFSGATHSRYEHSLDVLRLAQSAARRLLDDPTCRKHFDESDVEIFVVAALLHDINHLPLTHLYQESGLDVLRGHDLFLESLQYRHAGHVPLGELASQVLGQSEERIHRIIEGRWEDQASPADQVISSAINSGVDLDKLSYLRMDSDRSGLRFAAGIDSDGLLRAMRVVDWEKRDRSGTFIGRGLHIAFVSEALPLVETLVMARTRAFETLYWCDDNRAMMAQVLACARAIYQTDDGTEALADVLLEVRGDTDFAVLRRLDELAEESVGRSWQLSQLFDSIDVARPQLIYAASEPWERIRSLSPAERVDFETRLRSHLAPTLPSLESAGPGALMVDVPTRDLDLGGEILVVESDGRVRRALDVSDVVKTHAQRLSRLAHRVRMFVTSDAYGEWRDGIDAQGVEQMQRNVGQVVEAALGRSSMR